MEKKERKEALSKLPRYVGGFFSRPAQNFLVGRQHFQDATALWLTNWRPKCGGTRLNWVSGINVDCFYYQ